MFNQIKTSAHNRDVVTLLTRKFGLGAENVIARIAISYSLHSWQKLSPLDVKDSGGKEYSKNVHYYNGWKTNKAFKVNRKVIIPLYMSGYYWEWGGDGRYRLPWEFTSNLCDIEKVFDYLAGTFTPDHAGLARILDAAQHQGCRRGIETRHFIISVFKKGTCHIEFKNPELVKKFNIFGSQQKGWLPPGYGATAYAGLEPEAREVVDSFEGKDSYEQTLEKQDFYLLSASTAPMLPLCG